MDAVCAYLGRSNQGVNSIIEVLEADLMSDPAAPINHSGVAGSRLKNRNHPPVTADIARQAPRSANYGA